ncbi:MAG: DUF1559 domain-containing protein [Planctomycetes bacterium]|nr:DUF1559 domain-containing protein [Planctomycetota bacterium]
MLRSVLKGCATVGLSSSASSGRPREHCWTRQQWHPCGFTLVELLVVIIIIAMLMGLLTPAIIAARERARQTQCTDHQKNLAQAILQYELNKQQFPGHVNPMAWQVKSPVNANLVAGAGWPVIILQQLDRNDLWDALRTAKTPEELTDPKAGIAQQVALFLCPSAEPVGQAPLSYVANCGQRDQRPPAGLGNYSSNIPPDWPANGVFHRRYNDRNTSQFIVVKVRMEDIKDGARHTLLLSENLQAGQWLGLDGTKELTQGMLWWPEDGAITSHPNIAINVDRERPRSEIDALDETTVQPYYSRPSSYHPGGVVATFCDGHSQFINEEIDYLVYQLLMTPDGANAYTAGEIAPRTPDTLPEGKWPAWRTTPLDEAKLGQ